jgi:peptidoglycan L-alanyl-D-glutamate endopeptidase CwlK
MQNFIFSHRSEKNLQGVHPDLVRLVRSALMLSEVDFCVIEGVRTLDSGRGTAKP